MQHTPVERYRYLMSNRSQNNSSDPSEGMTVWMDRADRCRNSCGGTLLRGLIWLSMYVVFPLFVALVLEENAALWVASLWLGFLLTSCLSCGIGLRLAYTAGMSMGVRFILGLVIHTGQNLGTIMFLIGLAAIGGFLSSLARTPATTNASTADTRDPL